MQRHMRVQAFTKKTYRNGEFYEAQHLQRLQVRRWWGWQTVDEEEVPSHVQIAIGCFGSDPWQSKFRAVGSWGRDGVVKPHTRLSDLIAPFPTCGP